MNSVCIVQARLGSTRLPGKMLYELGGRSTIGNVLQRVRGSERIDDLVVATSTRDHDQALLEYIERNGTNVYQGSEDDVLRRLFDAAVQFQPDIVVRVCGDNPFVSPECIDAVIAAASDDDVDYSATNLEGTFPLGLDVEAFTMDSFRKVVEEAESPAHREHVTLYYKDNSDMFSIKRVSAADVFDSEFPDAFSNLRLTLDTPRDYSLLYDVYEALSEEDSIISLDRAVEYIVENEMWRLNESVEQKVSGGQNEDS